MNGNECAIPYNYIIVLVARPVNEVMIKSREEASNSMQKVLRRTVMVSSARQAVSGFLSAGGLNAARYVAKKMGKAWKSSA